MSAIAGIYHLDKQLVDRPLLGRMLECIPQWGSDAVRLWTDGFVGLGHRQLCTTEESLREVQPTRNCTGSCWLAFDGRVDNRQELIQRLRPKVGTLASPTDVDLVLYAYDTWGTDCLKWIIGDFAFALWDSREQQLFCGRDIYGIRPFYYHFDGNTFTFASDIIQLFQNPRISQDINHGKIAEWLTWCGIQGHGYRELTRTFFREVSELPFAHHLVIKSSGLTLRRYWDVDPKFQIRYRRQEDYIEHFSNLFREAVRCRLRSAGPVGAELSGGFDSSSVVSTAQEIYRSGEIKRQRFITFSMVFDELSCDERALIETVTDKYQLESQYVVADNLCGLQNFPPTKDSEHSLNNPDQFVVQKGAETLYRLASDQNVRVMLSGEGAESHVLGSYFVIDSLIRNFKWIELFDRLNVMRWQSSLRTTLHDLIRYGLIPLLPKSISQPLYYKWMYPGLSHPDFGNLFCPVFQESLIEEVTMQNIRLSAFPKFKGWGRQMEYEAFNQASPLLEMPIPLPIERRFPYHDRRLMDFCLAIPSEQKYQHLSETGKRSIRGRPLQRYGLRGILPEKIRQSQVKVNFDDVHKRRFTQFKDTYIQTFAPPTVPLVAALGIVDRDKFWLVLSDSLARVQISEPLNPYVKLWINRLTLLEIWLQTLSSFKKVQTSGKAESDSIPSHVGTDCSDEARAIV